MGTPIGKLGVFNDVIVKNGNLVHEHPLKSTHETKCYETSRESNGNDTSSTSTDSSTSSEDETTTPQFKQNEASRQVSDGKVPNSSIVRDILEGLKVVRIDDEAEEIIGNMDIKHFIEQAFLNQKLADDLQWQAALLVGLPGIGKSRIMKSYAANVVKLIKKPVSVFTVTAGDLMNKYHGQSEKSPKILYALAKSRAPSIVVIDEIDGVMRARSDGETDQSRRFKTSLLAQMQGVEARRGVFTICSTNRGAYLDKAFLRRFDRIFCIEIPNHQQRIEIFQKFTRMYQRTVDFNFDQIDFEKLSNVTEGYTGDDIKKIVAASANRNCLVQVDRKLVAYDEMEEYRDSLKTAPHAAKIVPVGLKTHQLLQAAKEIQPSYKMSDIKEIEKFKRACRIVTGVNPLGGIASHQDQDTEPIARDIQKQHTNEDDFCGCFNKACNPC